MESGARDRDNADGSREVVVPVDVSLGLCASVCRRNKGCPTSHYFVRHFVYSDVDFVRQPLRMIGEREIF